VLAESAAPVLVFVTGLQSPSSAADQANEIPSPERPWQDVSIRELAAGQDRCSSRSGVPGMRDGVAR
jgi:hypothetical protein